MSGIPEELALLHYMAKNDLAQQKELLYDITQRLASQTNTVYKAKYAKAINQYKGKLVYDRSQYSVFYSLQNGSKKTEAPLDDCQPENLLFDTVLNKKKKNFSSLEFFKKHAINYSDFLYKDRRVETLESCQQFEQESSESAPMNNENPIEGMDRSPVKLKLEIGFQPHTEEFFTKILPLIGPMAVERLKLLNSHNYNTN